MDILSVGESVDYTVAAEADIRRSGRLGIRYEDNQGNAVTQEIIRLAALAEFDKRFNV